MDKIKITNSYSKDLAWYLDDYGVNDENDLTFEKKAKLFIEVVSDFFEQSVSIYDLSIIGQSLWETLDTEQKSTRVGWAMYYAKEAEYYLHQRSIDSSKDVFRKAINTLEKILMEFEKNKSLGIEKDPKDLT